MGREFLPAAKMPAECSKAKSPLPRYAYKASCPLRVHDFDAFSFIKNGKKIDLSQIPRENTSEGIPDQLVYKNKDKKCFCFVPTICTPGDTTKVFEPHDDHDDDPSPGM